MVTRALTCTNFGGDLMGADHFSPAFALHHRVEPDTFCEQKFSSPGPGRLFLEGVPV